MRLRRGGALSLCQRDRCAGDEPLSPWFLEIKRLIDASRVGTLYGTSFRLRPGDGQGARTYLDRQPYFQTMERFLVHETAIHFIDTFRFLLGEPRSVYADLRRLNPAIAGEDAGLFILDHGAGVRAVFDGNRLSDHPADNRRLTMGEMMVDGSAGALRLDGWAGSLSGVSARTSGRARLRLARRSTAPAPRGAASISPASTGAAPSRPDPHQRAPT